MNSSKSRRTLSLLVLAVIAAAGVWAAWYYSASHRPKNDHQLPETGRPPVTVRFGMLPYGDHTYAIIGAKQGWFEEVGIHLDYRPVKVEDTVPFLLNGSLDVGSCSPGIIIAAHDASPGVVNFVFGDIFQGYAIMAQPGKGYKSVTEFTKDGLSLDDAIRATVRQLERRAFAYPAEAAIKPFIDLALRKGGLTRQDFQPLVLDDPLTVNAMRNRQADFQVGGVPSRLVLQREGFKPILTSNDLASAAKPSPESEELASIFTDGWACTRKFYDTNRDTVLRLASVNFRIMKFINEHADQALAIHMPYLSQVTGQTFTSAEGKIIYESLDPFYTFEAQRDWYHNPQSPYFYQNLNGAIINNFAKQGVFKGQPPTVGAVIVADQVYKDLEKLKNECDTLIAQVDRAEGLSTNGQVQELLSRARRLYAAYDYLDAKADLQRVLQLAQGGK